MALTMRRDGWCDAMYSAEGRLTAGEEGGLHEAARGQIAEEGKPKGVVPKARAKQEPEHKENDGAQEHGKEHPARQRHTYIYTVPYEGGNGHERNGNNPSQIAEG